MDIELDGATILILIAAGIIIALAVSYYLWRWVFSIRRQLWNQRQMINLLIMIAEKQGIHPSELEDIKKINNDKRIEYYY